MKSTLKSKALAALFGLALTAALTAPVSAAGPLRKVSVNYGLAELLPPTAIFTSVPERAGFWAAEGLDVSVEQAPGGAAALQQLVAGRVAMTWTSLANAFVVKEKGGDIKVVANAYSSSPFYPVALADGPIKSLKDLKGKRVGCAVVASSCQQWMKAILLAEGIDPAKDVTVVGVGEGASALYALQSGRIAALFSFDSNYAVMETRGAKLRRFNQNPVLKDLSFVSGEIVRSDTITKDPRLVVGLLRGVAKGVVFASANPEAAIRIHWKQFPTTKPRGVDEKKAMADAVLVLKSQLPLYSQILQKNWGGATPKQIDNMTSFLKKADVIKSNIRPTDIYTDKFVAEINNFDHEAVRVMALNYKGD